MKSLFDRTKIYQYHTAPDTVIDLEHADGIVIHARERFGELVLVYPDSKSQVLISSSADQPATADSAGADAAGADAASANAASAASEAAAPSAKATEEPHTQEKETAKPVKPVPLTLDSFLSQHKADTLDILLILDCSLDASGIKALLLTAKRQEMTERLLVASKYHKTLDALYKEEPSIRISPLCEEQLVRPWIYAAYLGAEVLCLNARDILIDADPYGSEIVDRAHNNSVMIYAVCSTSIPAHEMAQAEDVHTLRALAGVGCDAVLTHNPALAYSAVR
ncbi:MAG: hypothetical protein J6I50_05520 [Clostridia bacterium]|nr:hypothetical protein [Clostridia bacterium]